MWFEGPKGELFNLNTMSNIKVQVSVTAGSSWYVAAYEVGNSEEHRLSENLDEPAARDLCGRIARALKAQTANEIGKPGERGSAF